MPSYKTAAVRKSRTGAIVAAAMLGLVQLGPAAAPASAVVDMEAMKRAIDALQTLGQRIPEFRAKTRPLPRLDDGGEGDKLLRAVWNIDAVVKARPQEAKGTSDLMAWSETATALVRLFVFEGDAKTPDAIAANEAKYRKEIALGTAFGFRISATTMQGVADHLSKMPPAEANSPARQAGMKQVSGGLRMQALGMIMLIGKSDGQDANARVLAEALADDIGLVAGLFTPDVKAEIADAVAKSIPNQNDPVVKAALLKVEKAARAP